MSARLAERIGGVPWLILESALQSIIEIANRDTPDPDNLAAWKQLLSPAMPEALDLRAASPLPGARRAQIRDGVAIIRISGPIFRHAGLFTELSGATALSDVALDLGLARDDSRVRGILLAVDSPGGEATGIGEAASAIRAAAQVKPVATHVEGVAGSAAFWLGLAAGEVVAAPQALLGSIGVVMRLTDAREREARSGVRTHEFVSSQTPGKRPDPETDAGRRSLQAIVDAMAEEFIAEAAGFRDMTGEALLSATNGGDLVIGRRALATGLIDRLGSFEETLARLSRGEVPLASTKPPPGPRPHGKDPLTMTNPTPAPLADAATPPAAPPAPPAPPQASAPPAPPPAPPADPVAVERARASAIQAAMKPGFTALATLAIQQGWSPETFAQAQDASATAVTEAARSAQAQAFSGSLPAPIAGSGDPPDPSTLPPEERAKAEWAKDAKLRAEFGNSFETYLAYAKAEARNVVKLVSRR